MNESYEMLLDNLGIMLKIMLLSIIVFIFLQYTIINVAMYKIVEDAEENGRFTVESYEEHMKIIGFDTDDIDVIAKPNFGEHVNKLGDPLKLVFKKEIEITVFDKKISIPVTIRKDGINHGYYGEGY